MNIDWSKAPEGATHWVGSGWPWHRHVNGKAAYWDEGVWISLEMPASRVEKEYADSIQARPVAPWNGEGLPPVGTVCEWCHTDGVPWTGPVEILFLSKHTVLLRHPRNGDNEGAYSPVDCKFRPLGSAEQIAADEREKTIQQFCQELDVPHAIGSRAYDAGYRKVQP